METLDDFIRDKITCAIDELVGMERAGLQLDREIMTIDETADFLRVSVSGLRKLRTSPRKKFPKAVYYNRRPMFIRSEVLDWAKERRE